MLSWSSWSSCSLHIGVSTPENQLHRFRWRWRPWDVFIFHQCKASSVVIFCFSGSSEGTKEDATGSTLLQHHRSVCPFICPHGQEENALYTGRSQEDRIYKFWTWRSVYDEPMKLTGSEVKSKQIHKSSQVLRPPGGSGEVAGVHLLHCLERLAGGAELRSDRPSFLSSEWKNCCRRWPALASLVWRGLYCRQLENISSTSETNSPAGQRPR